MKKLLKNLANSVLDSYGHVVVKKHEISHKDFKYNEAVSEIYHFFQDEVFKEKLPKNQHRVSFLRQLYGTQLSEAMYLLYYLNRSVKLSGDVCEFGCANGATSALLANEILKTKKKLWLFDSFQGLSRPTREDTLINDIFKLGSMKKYEGTMSYRKEEVISRLQKTSFTMNEVEIVDGFIEKSIKRDISLNKICFAFVDFDLYRPIKTALQFIDSRIVKDGYILVDDYGFFSSGVKKAVDEFVKNKKYKKILPKKFAGGFCILQKEN